MILYVILTIVMVLVGYWLLFDDDSPTTDSKN